MRITRIQEAQREMEQERLKKELMAMKIQLRASRAHLGRYREIWNSAWVGVPVSIGYRLLCLKEKSINSM